MPQAKTPECVNQERPAGGGHHRTPMTAPSGPFHLASPSTDGQTRESEGLAEKIVPGHDPGGAATRGRPSPLGFERDHRRRSLPDALGASPGRADDGRLGGAAGPRSWSWNGWPWFPPSRGRRGRASALSPCGTPCRLPGAGFEPHERSDRPAQLGIHPRGVLGDGGRLLAWRDLRDLRGQLLLQAVDLLEDSQHAPMPRLWAMPTWRVHASSPFPGIHGARSGTFSVDCRPRVYQDGRRAARGMGSVIR